MRWKVPRTTKLTAIFNNLFFQANLNSQKHKLDYFDANFNSTKRKLELTKTQTLIRQKANNPDLKSTKGIFLKICGWWTGDVMKRPNGRPLAC